MLVGLALAVLLWGGVAELADLGAAHARPGPAPQSWPGCPPDHPEGPCHWCPGDPPVQTGNLRVDPVRWDANVCHTYWYVGGGGNVARTIWEGDAPPPPPPPLTGLYCDPATLTNCHIGTHP
jgi:hypothetical protein